ncbi:MAG: hypothetical protein ACHREM_06650 [Polyangiales bacterium]
MNSTRTALTLHPAVRRLALRIAAQLLCDPRSVEREIASPGTVRGVVGVRIREALAAEQVQS